MGYTFSPFGEGADALEGVFGHGWKSSVCGAALGGRTHGGAVPWVWDLPQDRQECGIHGLTDRSRRPYRYAHQLPFQVENFILNVKREHSSWGARKFRERLIRRFSGIPVPAKSTIHAACVAVRKARPYLWGNDPTNSGAPTTKASSCWATATTATPWRSLITPAGFSWSVKRSLPPRKTTLLLCFERLFQERGLPANIRSDNGVPFASAHALFHLSKLAVWWLRLGIGIERIKPGHPQQNGRHERMHLTLKKEATKPAAANFLQQQARFDNFIDVFNNQRPH
jgi:putative transposase